MMRYLEVFAGAGGLSLGLDRAGFTPVLHVEMDPHAQSVLRRHWPDVPLHDDVRTLDATAWRGVDLVTGGSPCQDLSVAGKRAGLVGARSGLFYEQIRIWEETGATYCLWENVGGALSSQKGADFACVLSAFVGRPVAARKWGRGGVVSGPRAVAAWRVLDLQHVGPERRGLPQRRVRVFVLAARPGGVDPAEVLALGEGVCRHPAPRREAREDAPAGVAGSLGGGSGQRGFCDDLDRSGMFPVCTTDVVTQPIAYDDRNQAASSGVHHTLRAGGIGLKVGDAVVQPIAFALRGRDGGAALELSGDTVNTLRGASGGSSRDMVVHPVIVDERQVTSPTNRSNPQPGGPSCTLHGQAGSMIAFHATQDPISGDVAPRLGATSGGTAAVLASGQRNAEIGVGVSPSLTCLHEAPITTTDLRPRRLIPLECERLMGWPDDWSAQGVREDGTTYRLTDGPRYRLCGNGVGSPCAEWIGRRLLALEAALPALREEAA